MRVDLVSPEEILFSGDCTQVATRTAGGEIAFLDNHAPFIGTLKTGAVRLWLTDGSQSAIAVQGGFVEVSNNAVTILSDAAEPSDRIDPVEAQRQLEEAEAALRSDAGNEDLLAAVAWARTRLRVATNDFSH